MHRNWFLLLLPAIACDTEPQRGPTATTIAIMETEPRTAEPTTSPPLASIFDIDEGLETSVEAGALELAEAAPPLPEELPRGVTVEVRAGENLVLLARWAGSSVEALAELNGLDVSEPLYPGQSLLIPSADEAGDTSLISARESFAQARLDRYLERRGGLMAVEEHRVRTGETAWGIARDQLGIPTWVLAAYNPESDLEHLGIGDRLMVPVLSDTVADAVTSAPEAEEPELLTAPPEPTVWEIEEELEGGDELALPTEIDFPSIETTIDMAAPAEF
jgi:hypothetical protein